MPSLMPRGEGGLRLPVRSSPRILCGDLLGHEGDSEKSIHRRCQEIFP